MMVAVAKQQARKPANPAPNHTTTGLLRGRATRGLGLELVLGLGFSEEDSIALYERTM
jgi:hypothetical protein